jgi:hypothetical protein
MAQEKVVGEFGWFGVGKAFEIEKGHFYWVGEFSGTFFSDKGAGGMFHRAGVKCPAYFDADTNTKKSKAGGYCIVTDTDGDQAFLTWQNEGNIVSGPAPSSTGGTGNTFERRNSSWAPPRSTAAAPPAAPPEPLTAVSGRQRKPRLGGASFGGAASPPAGATARLPLPIRNSTARLWRRSNRASTRIAGFPRQPRAWKVCSRSCARWRRARARPGRGGAAPPSRASCRVLLSTPACRCSASRRWPILPDDDDGKRRTHETTVLVAAPSSHRLRIGRCLVLADDAGIDAGAMQPLGLEKFQRAQDIALQNKLPFVHLVESAGANLLKYRVEHFILGGKGFYNLARLSAAGLPVIAVVHGSSTAGARADRPDRDHGARTREAFWPGCRLRPPPVRSRPTRSWVARKCTAWFRAQPNILPRTTLTQCGSPASCSRSCPGPATTCRFPKGVRRPTPRTSCWA